MIRRYVRPLAASGAAVGIVRLAGLTRDYLLTRWIGLGPDLDPYFLAFSVFVIAFGVLHSVVYLALLPGYSSGSAVLTIRRANMMLQAGVGTVLAGLILARLIPGGAVAALLLVSLVPASGSLAFSALLVSSGRQAAGVLPGLALAVVPIGGALILDQDLSLAQLVSFIMSAYLVELVVLYLLSRRLQVVTGDGLRRAFGLSTITGLGGASLISTSWLVIDLAFVRWIGPTAVSVYSLATRIPQGIVGVVVPAITNVLMPAATRSLGGAHDPGEYWPTLRRLTSVAFAVGVGLALTNLGLSFGLRDLAFAGSAVSSDEAAEIFATQAILGFMLPWFIAGLVVVRYLQTTGDHKPILMIGGATLAVNAAADAAFSIWLGVRGIALATVVAYTFSCSALVVVVKRQARRF